MMSPADRWNGPTEARMESAMFAARFPGKRDLCGDTFESGTMDNMNTITLQVERIVIYRMPMMFQPIDADDEMQLRDLAAHKARMATGGTVVSVNRGRKNMVVRVAVR